MTRTKQIDTILAAYSSLPSDLYDGWRNVREHLLDMNKEAERRHRKGESTPKSFSAPTAAKYFVVHHLLDAIAVPDRWTVDDILNIRTECLYAQAYAKKYMVQLRDWADKWREPMDEVDYAELMKVAS